MNFLVDINKHTDNNMTCLSCQNNGNSIGCPCQEVHKENYGSNFVATATTPRGVVTTDVCTGEVKQVLPHFTHPKKTGYDVLAVKLVPQAVVQDNTQPCQQRKKCNPEKKLQCYTCGPKRANAYPADHQCYSLMYLDNFKEFNVGDTEQHTYNNYSTGIEFRADDGKYKINKDYLELRCPEFKKTYKSKISGELHPEGCFDHLKTIAVLNSEFEVPKCGEVYAEACMSARTMRTEKHPFGCAVINSDSDFRLGCAIFSMMEISTGLNIAILITNDSYWALYEKKANEEDDDDEIKKEPGANSFAFAKRIGRRNSCAPLSDFSRLGIAVDKTKGANWYIDGVLKHTINRLGFPENPADALYQYGGAPAAIDPTCVHVSFGFCTMLDAVQPDNHGNLEASGKGLVRLTNFKYKHPWVLGREVEFEYEKPNRDKMLWGQGATLRIKELKVELRA